MRIRKYSERHPWRTVGFVSGILFFVFMVWWQILPKPLFQEPYATVLTDRNGKIIGLKLAADEQLRLGEVKYLPERYVLSVLSFEDRMFMMHRGVSWWAIGRAVLQNIRSGRIVSGGSTLSMQVVRMSRGNPPRTVWEKIKEIFLALRMERSFSKWQILGMYASHAPFGGNVVGLQAASLKYFDRQPEQLSWAEAALLAVLPNAPSLIYPGKNNALLLQKRNALLKKMHSQGLMGEDTYHLALAEPLPEKLHHVPALAPHLLVRADAEGAGRIHRSYIDGHLQKRINAIVERHISVLSQNYIYNAAVLVVHVPTGEVRAYVGNSAPRKGSRGNQVDIVRSARSSGSILKPVLYALMLQNGMILPRSLVPDIPSRFGSYAPSNFNRDFRGAVPADEALAQSLNIPFVRMLRDYSYARFYDDLKQLGISTLHRSADHYGLSLILGGAETSLWDVCQLYVGMASTLRHYNEKDGQYFGGEYEKMKLWRKDTCSAESGNTGRLLRASAIWQTLKALEKVERPEMESGWKNFVSSLNLSWKTGTSFGFRDAWAVGVNPDYVIGVWVGNADGEGRPGLVGVRAAAPILFEVAALLKSDSQFFEPIEEMRESAVCRKSGFRASPFCMEADTVRICVTGNSTDVCPFHRLVHLDKDERWRVSSECESTDRIRVKPWFVLPPVQEWYYCRSHADYLKLPPFRPDCQSMGEEVMEMIYPPKGTRIFIPRDFGGCPERIVLEAVHRSPEAEIYWHADDCYLGKTVHLHQMEVYLREGKHKLTLVDGQGNMLQQTFRVVGK